MEKGEEDGILEPIHTEKVLVQQKNTNIACVPVERTRRVVCVEKRVVDIKTPHPPRLLNPHTVLETKTGRRRRDAGVDAPRDDNERGV